MRPKSHKFFRLYSLSLTVSGEQYEDVEILVEIHSNFHLRTNELAYANRFNSIYPICTRANTMSFNFTFHLSNNVIRIILNVSICPIVQVFNWTKWIHIPTCYTYCPPCQFRLVLKMNESHFSCVSPTSNN